MLKLHGKELSIRSYAEARRFLGARDQCKVVNNTYLEKRDGGAIALRFYRVDVVRYEPDGRVILNTSGWKTKTTKERINTFSPLPVEIKRGIWFVDGRRFVDGMQLSFSFEGNAWHVWGIT